jgi:hypothetical protein
MSGGTAFPEKEMREIMAIAMRMDSMKILCGVPFKEKTLAELLLLLTPIWTATGALTC